MALARSIEVIRGSVGGSRRLGGQVIAFGLRQEPVEADRGQARVLDHRLQLFPAGQGDVGNPGGESKTRLCSVDRAEPRLALAPRITDVTLTRRKELKAMVEDSGLETIGTHWLLAKTQGYYLTHPNAAVRRRTGDYLVALAELTRDLAAP